MARGQTQLAIRDDGMLYPATPKILQKPQYRLYRGSLDATLEERMNWLRGETMADENDVTLQAELGIFDASKADKPALIEFALNEYGVRLDARKGVDTLRVEVIDLAKASAAQ